MIRDDYRSIILDNFQAKRLRNPSYSLRSFARDMGCSPGRLSQTLNGKAGISPKMANRIAERLFLSETEKELFTLMTIKKHGRSSSIRQAASSREKEIRSKNYSNQISNDQFELIANWHHLAIVELLKLKNFKPSFKAIGQKLGLPAQGIKESVKRLVQSNLIVMNRGQIKLGKSSNIVGDLVPSEAIRRFHAQVLSKALDSINNQSVSERYLSSSFVAINKDDIPRISAKIQEFRQQICNEFGANDKQKKEILYCISTQLFSLERGPNP